MCHIKSSKIFKCNKELAIAIIIFKSIQIICWGGGGELIIMMMIKWAERPPKIINRSKK